MTDGLSDTLTKPIAFTTEKTAHVDYEILVDHCSLLDWRVQCEYLTIKIDCLSAIEAINLATTIVQVLEAMFP